MTPGFLDLKNSRNLARWRWRWHLQAGGRFWIAHDLRDLRNEDDLQRWRLIEFKRRHLPVKVRKVVSVAAWRIANAKRRRSRLQATA